MNILDHVSPFYCKYMRYDKYIYSNVNDKQQEQTDKQTKEKKSA